MGKTRDVREAVEKELSYDPRVDAADISVKNINGEVALTGRVPSYPQYLETARAAWRVAGVTEVHSHLEVVLPPGAVRDDAMLTTAANNALAADATVPEGAEATARNGDLTLTGAVQYLSQRAAVEKVVSGADRRPSCPGRDRRHLWRRAGRRRAAHLEGPRPQRAGARRQ